MREHLFRIKDHGEWYYGFPMAKRIVTDDKYVGFIGYDANGQSYYNAIADADTLSEFTGLYDKNGKRIFEGDLLKITSTVFGGIIEQQVQKREDIALVEYDTKTGGYRLKVYNNGKYKRISKFSDGHLCAYDAEVIGNKWDNQELLTRGVSNEGN